MSVQNDRPTTDLPIPLGEHDRPALILIMGGTFDPPHIGHVQLPVSVRDELERRDNCPGRGWLLFVPAARSPHKSADPVVSDEDRVRMLTLAIESTRRAKVWTDEIDRASGSSTPSYSVETLERARRWLDDRGMAGCPLRLLIGADQAVAFHSWRQPRDILRLAKPAVMVRGDVSSADELLKRIEKSRFWNSSELAMWEDAIVPVGRIDVSASQVRTALARGDLGQIGRMLAPDVARYIAARELYRRDYGDGE